MKLNGANDRNEGSLMEAGFLCSKRRRVEYQAGVLFFILTLGCSALVAGGTADTRYDQNSWESMIADDCRVFFDGCNNCMREPGHPAACTRKACAQWKRPQCRDEEAGSETSAKAGGARIVDYVCDDGRTFSVIYGEYRQDDQHIQLSGSEILLRDDQSQSLYRLQRQRSASGEKYGDDSGFEFFGKGDEAIVTQGDERLYSGCQTTQ